MDGKFSLTRVRYVEAQQVTPGSLVFLRREQAWALRLVNEEDRSKYLILTGQAAGAVRTKNSPFSVLLVAEQGTWEPRVASVIEPDVQQYSNLALVNTEVGSVFFALPGHPMERSDWTINGEAFNLRDVDDRNIDFYNEWTLASVTKVDADYSLPYCVVRAS